MPLSNRSTVAQLASPCNLKPVNSVCVNEPCCNSAISQDFSLAAQE